MRLRYDCSLEEIAQFTTTVEHIVFALCLTILAITLCHFQSPYLQCWLGQGATQVPASALERVAVGKSDGKVRNQRGRRGGGAPRPRGRVPKLIGRDNPLGAYLRERTTGNGRGRGQGGRAQVPSRGESGRRAVPLPEVHLLRRASRQAGSSRGRHRSSSPLFPGSPSNPEGPIAPDPTDHLYGAW
jgi:hypothetical protein